MILAINVGNTHTSFGCVDEEKNVSNVLSIPTDTKETSFGYAAKMKQIFDLTGLSLHQLEGAILSSVVPPVTEVMKKAVKLLIGKEPMVLGAGVKTGLHICIDDPGTIASDLVATAVAAKELYPVPCVIIDMGTATTLTCVNQDGKYIGGAILPGVQISLEALTEDTSLLPKIDISAPKRAISSSTVESMRSGIVYGTVGAIDGILDRFTMEFGALPKTVISTGGLGKVILPYSRYTIIEDEKLLLKGLGIIYCKNQK